MQRNERRLKKICWEKKSVEECSICFVGMKKKIVQKERAKKKFSLCGILLEHTLV
jgi:hypothetical protein